MKLYHILVITVFTTCICFLKGQQTTRKSQPKLNRFFANISRECLKEHRVTPERVVGVYALNINDREAKCYVACMLVRFNVTNEKGGYNEKELEALMSKPNSNKNPISMKTALQNCEKEGHDKDRCEKAVKFTKCIYSHKNEFGYRNNTSSAHRQRPTLPFGTGGRRRPWSRT